MPEEDIQKLKACCEDFKQMRNNTEDGNGQNLHDIKHTFDYVRNYIQQNNLSDTVFGNGLSQKAEKAGNVLSELWLCLQNLEESVEGFCESQSKLNNSDQ